MSNLDRLFPILQLQKSIDLDMAILDCYAQQLSKVEWYIQQQAKQHNPKHFHLLKSAWGIGPILATDHYL